MPEEPKSMKLKFELGADDILLGSVIALAEYCRHPIEGEPGNGCDPYRELNLGLKLQPSLSRSRFRVCHDRDKPWNCGSSDKKNTGVWTDC